MAVEPEEELLRRTLELLLREDELLLRVVVEEELRVLVPLLRLPVEVAERLTVRAPLPAEALRVVRFAGVAEELRRGAVLTLLRVVVPDFAAVVTRDERVVPVLRRTWLEGDPLPRPELPDRRVLRPSVERRVPKYRACTRLPSKMLRPPVQPWKWWPGPCGRPQ